MSTLPAAVQAGVEAALQVRLGRPARLHRVERVGGGCISPSARVQVDSGEVAFVKWRDAGSEIPGLFREEARALEALAATGTVRVPVVWQVSDPEAGGASWLLLEWLEPGRPGADTWHRLARELAALHRVTAQRYGWETDNFIGPLPQANGWSAEWPGFWRERRLVPQLELALEAGHFDAEARRQLDRLVASLDELLAGAAGEGASLLHGDLWGGNVHLVEDGTAALIDPSCSYGHREVDLAMSELFGGFGEEFYPAYREAWPLSPDYERVRRPIYQLYYLLVHVNLFGRGYVSSTLATIGRIPL